jgi:cyclophilin family peptidyl-prolyl cis-trans isomerase/predicted DsbA family dithiol-disulfide isomerase
MAILRFLRRRFQTSSLARFLTIVMLSAPLTACTGPKNTPQSMPKTPTSKAVELGPTSTTLPTLPTDSPPDPTPTLRPLPPIDESDHSLGVPDADITLLVYSDFQCPFCADFYQSWSQIEERHPGKLRLVFRHFPLLSLHDKADLAGAAAEVASESGKFWEMHDALFEGQSEWADLDRVAFVDWLTQTAAAIELDPELFLDDLASGDELEAMTQSYQEGLMAGIPGTPFLFLNGEWYRLNPTAINLEASIQLELISQRHYSTPPQLDLSHDDLIFANLELDQGEIVIQLFPAIAPANVASFIFLAQDGWFDNIGFHGVQSGRLVESGDPTGTGLGGPGYLLLDEVSDTLNFDEAGMVAMSSAGPNTNGSRFFINLAPLPHLNGARTIIGQVIEGMDLIAALHDRDPYQDLFKPYDLKIHTIRIETR